MSDRENDLKTLTVMAKVLDVHPATLRAWAKSETIPYYRIGKKYFFKIEEVLKNASNSGNMQESKSIQSFCSANDGLCISNGYLQIKIGKHPMADKKGYVQVHRLIMQAKIGRLLNDNEIVHHKNGHTLDNRIDNLEIKISLGKHNHEKRSKREDREK